MGVGGILGAGFIGGMVIVSIIFTICLIIAPLRIWHWARKTALAVEKLTQLLVVNYESEESKRLKVKAGGHYEKEEEK